MNFKHWKINWKLYALMAVFLTGFLLFAWGARDTLEIVRVKGPVYNGIIEGKDIVADILPPRSTSSSRTSRLSRWWRSRTRASSPP